MTVASPSCAVDDTQSYRDRTEEQKRGGRGRVDKGGGEYDAGGVVGGLRTVDHSLQG